jgi:hypothetical protein
MLHPYLPTYIDLLTFQIRGFISFIKYNKSFNVKSTASGKYKKKKKKKKKKKMI